MKKNAIRHTRQVIPNIIHPGSQQFLPSSNGGNSKGEDDTDEHGFLNCDDQLGQY
jgi:hypothetical protein